MKKILKILSFLLFVLPNLVFASPKQVDFLLSGLTDNSGQPLNAGKVYTYVAGTTTNKTTWSDYGELSALSNPVVLDAYGKKQVFADGLYKFVIKDSNDVTLYTFDNLLFRQYNGSDTWAGATTGSANAYVATLSPPLLSLIDGAEISFIASFTSSSAPTLNVNSLGPKTILRHDLSAVVSKDIMSGAAYTARYSTSNSAWVLQAPALGYTTWTSGLTPQAGSASAITYNVNNYIQLGKLVCIQLDISWTQGTASAPYLTIALPVTAAVAGQSFAAWAAYDGTPRSAYSYIVTTTTVRIFDAGNNSFTVGAGREMNLSGCYFAS